MIRAKLKGRDGRPIMLLGITDTNIKRMRKGAPVFFEGSELGYNGWVAIITGRDEETIRGSLEAQGLAMPSVADPSPPIECHDSAKPIPHIRAERSSDKTIRLLSEKGIPDNLSRWLLHEVSTRSWPASHLTQMNHFIDEELIRLVTQGRLHRFGMRPDILWVLDEPEVP